MAPRGPANHRWNGGTSEYPNHGQMKKVRWQKLKALNFKCQICKEPAKEIHHLDGNKANHDPNNIIVVCHACHFRIFHKQPHASKYSKIYGMKLKQIADKLRMWPNDVIQMHRAGLLKDKLKHVGR